MLDSLEPIMKQLTLLNTLIRLEDPAIADFLEKSNTLPYFCLSWVITWCSHDVRDLSKVVRLFDFFISSDPLISIYLSARVSNINYIKFLCIIKYKLLMIYIITGCH